MDNEEKRPTPAEPAQGEGPTKQGGRVETVREQVRALVERLTEGFLPDDPCER